MLDMNEDALAQLIALLGSKLFFEFQKFHFFRQLHKPRCSILLYRFLVPKNVRQERECSGSSHRVALCLPQNPPENHRIPKNVRKSSNLKFHIFEGTGFYNNNRKANKILFRTFQRFFFRLGMEEELTRHYGTIDLSGKATEKVRRKKFLYCSDSEFDSKSVRTSKISILYLLIFFLHFIAIFGKVQTIECL